MHVMVSPDERRLIEAVLAFANLRAIRSPAVVQRVFSRVSIEGFKDVDWVGTVPADAFRKDQGHLREWLGAIAHRGYGAAREIIPVLEERFDRGVLEIHPVFRAGALVPILRVKGVEGAFTYAVALILDRRRGLAPRLGQCAAPRCGRFRLDFEGRPHTYCSEAHRLAYDRAMAAERMRAYRKRKQAERGGRKA